MLSLTLSFLKLLTTGAAPRILPSLSSIEIGESFMMMVFSCVTEYFRKSSPAVIVTLIFFCGDSKLYVFCELAMFEIIMNKRHIINDLTFIIIMLFCSETLFQR